MPSNQVVPVLDDAFRNQLLVEIGLNPANVGDVSFQLPGAGVIALNINVLVTPKQWKAAIRKAAKTREPHA